MSIKKTKLSLVAILATTALSASAAWAQGVPTSSAPPAGSTPSANTDSGTVQTTEVTETSEADIVVTGIRGSLDAALSAKRDSAQFVDAIVASDIGKLPDTNIAESLQRVSGVQIRRALGEGTSVSIRGLRQNRTEVNGRTLASPSGRGRGFDSVGDSDYNPLSLFPSELISRLEVTKLLSADQVDGSLGGTVNVITRKPLDRPGQAIAVSASGVYSDLADRFGYDASALYSNSFADDTFGVLLNLTYSNKPVIDQSFNSFAGYGLLTSAFNTPTAPRANDPNGDGLPGTFIADLRYQQLEETRKRIGGNAAIQFKPTDDFELYADVIYSHLDTDRRRNWLSVPLSSVAGDYVNYTLSANEVLVAGTVNRPVQSNDERLTVASDSISGAFGGKFVSGGLTVRPEVSYNHAKLTNRQTFVRIATIANQTVSFDFRGGEVPLLTLPATLDLNNAAGLRFSNVFDNRFIVRTTEAAARLDFRYELGGGFMRAFEFGGRYADLRHRRTGLVSQIGVNVPLTSVSNSLYGPFTVGNLLGGKAPFAQSYIAANPFGTGAQFACVALGATCTPEAFNPTQSFRINEKTAAAYAKLNFATELGGGRALQGNIGLRYTETRRLATGTQQLGAVLSPIVAEPHFVDWLPSAVVKFEATDKLVLRLGAAKVVGLPDIADLSPGIVLATAPPLQGNAGNPNLLPFRATQFDAGIEWYYAQGAALTLGLFYKDVSSFIVQRSAIEFPTGPANPYSILRSYNGDGGKVKGFEVLFQQPFTFLPGALDGFGVLANFSYIDSTTSVKNTRTGEALPLQGLSKINYNLVGYYEKYGAGVRLAYNFRSKYFDSVATTGEGVFFDAYHTLDASVRYDFGNMSIFADATNLTNAAQKRYTGSVEAISLYAKQGRRYSVGVSAKF